MEVRNYLIQHHMVNPGNLVIAAVSGGADSACLLLMLEELRDELGYKLEAVHVEHGIRGEESLADAHFVEDLCQERGIPLHVYTVDVPGYVSEHGGGLEETARKLRYEAFARAADEKVQKDYAPEQIKIALAHHMQDQAETVLFRLARGTGIAGLAGMEPVRRDERGYTYIRPLLGTAREEIEAYLAERGQTYCMDATNLDENYARNRIRGQVLPELSKVNAQAARHITQTAELAAEQQDYIEEAALRELYQIARFEPRGDRKWNRMEQQEAEQQEAKQQEAKQQEAESANAKSANLEENTIAWSTEQKSDRIAETERISVDINKLNRLHPALQREVLRQALCEVAAHRKDLTSGHVQQLMELMQKTSGSRISLPYGVQAVREFDRLVIQKRPDEGKSKKERNKENGAGACYHDESQSAEDLQAEEPEQITISPNQIQKWMESGEEVGLQLSSTEMMHIRFSICEVSQKGVRQKSRMARVGTEDDKQDSEMARVNSKGLKDRLTIQYRELTTEENLSDFRKKSYTRSFNYDMIKGGFTIRRRRPSDYFYMKDGHRKKLKQYLIEEKIPASERQKLWLLASGSQVLWVAGICFPEV